MSTFDRATGKIAFLGMGIMGAAMAANLARQGYSVFVWNRTPGRAGEKKAEAAGAIVKSSLLEAVREADVVFSCLGDVEDVEQVLTGCESVLSCAKKGALIVDTSTIGAEAARNVAGHLQNAGYRFLDAPVTGGDIGAREGTLTIMVGGEKEDFNQILPLLEVLGKTVRHCGPVGTGQALKLCNQVLCAVNMIAVSEALTLSQALGVDANLVVDVLKNGAGGSWALENLGRRIVNDDLAPGFMLKHMIKDLRLIEENTCDSNLDLPGTNMAMEMFQRLARSTADAETALGTQSMIKEYRKE